MAVDSLLAGHAGEDTELRQEDRVRVGNEAVVDDVGVAPVFGGVTLDVEDDVRFVFGAGSVLERDEKFGGVKVDAELMRTPAAADTEIAEQRFLTGERFFAGDLVPLFAFFDDGVGNALPDDTAQRNGRFMIQALFLRLEIFR